MVVLLLALSLSVAPAARDRIANSPAVQAGKLEKLLDSCRDYVRLAYRTNDSTALDAYVDFLLKNPRRNHDEIVACAAYMRGVMDMDGGR